MLGYGDFLITASLAMLAIALAACVYLYVESNKTFESLGSTISFEKTEYEDRKGHYSVRVKFSSPQSAIEKYLYFKERDIHEYFQSDSFGNKYSIDEDDQGLTVGYKDVNGRLLFESTVFKANMTFADYPDVEGFDSFCKRFVNATMSGTRNWFTIHGFEPTAVEKGCKNEETVPLDLRYKWNRVFDYRFIAADMGGSLVWLGAQSLIRDFDIYIGDSVSDMLRKPGAIKYFVRRTQFHFHDLQETFLDQAVFHNWRRQYGHDHLLEMMGMPWSSFFVVTILTSGFIWIVIGIHVLVYPLALFAESHWVTSSWLDVATKPFLCTSVVLSLYILLAAFLFF